METQDKTQGWDIGRKVGVVAVVFGVFLAAVVVLADAGLLPSWIKQVWTWPMGDKVAHFTLLGAMAMLVSLWLRGAGWRLGPIKVFKGEVAVGLVVLAEEVSQRWVPHRTFSLGDLAADFLGIACFGVVARLLARRWWPEARQEAKEGPGVQGDPQAK